MSSFIFAVILTFALHRGIVALRIRQFPNIDLPLSDLPHTYRDWVTPSSPTPDPAMAEPGQSPPVANARLSRLIAWRAFRLGPGLVVEMTVGTYTAVVSVLSISALLGLLFLIVAPAYFPGGWPFRFRDIVFSPKFASAVFGILTGLLLSHVLRRITSMQDGQLGYRDKFSFILLLSFLVLGLGGEDALRSLGQRTNKLSYAGVEIGFADSASRGQRFVPEQVSNAVRTQSSQSSYSRYEASSGLELLVSLDSTIIKDRVYSKLMGVDAEAKLDDIYESSFQFASTMVSPFAQCLSGYHGYTAELPRNQTDNLEQIRLYLKDIALPSSSEGLVNAKNSYADRLAEESQNMIAQSHRPLESALNELASLNESNPARRDAPRSDASSKLIKACSSL